MEIYSFFVGFSIATIILLLFFLLFLHKICEILANLIGKIEKIRIPKTKDLSKSFDEKLLKGLKEYRRSQRKRPQRDGKR